jgi:CubicO group peptidase (beta-lactamase class C family)
MIAQNQIWGRIMVKVFSALIAGVCLASLASAGWAETATPHVRPTAEVLFWNQTQRESGFPHMEDQFPVHTVKTGDHVLALSQGNPISVSVSQAGQAQTLDQFMAEQKTAGILVIKDGKVRLEKYALGYGSEGRWTSFSVAKSFTSTLVGAAIKDGYIKSLNDPITQYIPGLKGSAYEGVSVQQLLTMTSGVKWNEDYTDPKSDVAMMFTVQPDPGVDATVSYMRKLPREAAPGSKWVYKTGETNLIGVLVTSATNKTLADYLTQKIWQPYGMEHDGVWMVDDKGQEPGGCCVSVSLRDYGRMGMFLIGGGMAGGKPVLPDGWIAAATTKQADIGAPGHGYGYQWWTNDDGTFDARGIFGQFIHVDPARKLVVVLSSAWPTATDPARNITRTALIGAIVAQTDANP